jgi:hypothetical protein
MPVFPKLQKGKTLVKNGKLTSAGERIAVRVREQIVFTLFEALELGYTTEQLKEVIDAAWPKTIAGAQKMLKLITEQPK